MCGLGGIVVPGDERVNVAHLHEMETSMVHRGPDDGETWTEPSGSAGLVHRRLSIIDLSPTGHQPMHTVDGRYTIVFNGEIYNYQTLRSQLVAEGIKFRGSSDTEVILELYARKGPACVNELAGMFALAIWDRDERQLFLARDPLGIKPLYVWQTGGKLAFASELRTILAARLAPREIDAQAVAGYLLMGSVQEPNTLVKDVSMLPAGHSLLWRNGKSQQLCYWQLSFPLSELATSPTMDWSSAVAQTRRALTESLERHFVADVPVGIFLSGGIDSTALVSLAHQAGYRNIKTFSIAFEEVEFNEGDLARRTAEHFGTDHSQWLMTSQDGQALFEQFSQAMDQPTNDGFNTFCVSKFAHDQGIKVVLSGLGGDELFGSYPSFTKIPQLMKWHRVSRWLGPARRWIGQSMGKRWSTGPRARLAQFIESTGDIRSAYGAMRGSFSSAATRQLVEHFTGQRLESIEHAELIERLPGWNTADQISYLELTRYMRNQLLRDSDVMSMAWSLELRVPFVDQVLADVVTAVPYSHRLAVGKRLLVEASGGIPDWILNQPKRGFRFPFQKWISTNPDWSEMFRATVARAPVKPEAWYQQWMLVVLEKALSRVTQVA